MKNSAQAETTINQEVADRLQEVALLLNEQRANPYRVEAYRRAADMLRRLRQPLTEMIASQGLDGLEELPGIGHSLARSIYQLVKTGRLPMLERLRGESDPVGLLASVPGIGKALAQRLHDDLELHSLEELEAAAHDGRLGEIEGIGAK